MGRLAEGRLEGYADAEVRLIAQARDLIDRVAS
jgi:hypothetical protein